MHRRRLPRIPLNLHELSRVTDLFRVSGAVKRDPAVEAWLSEEPVELRSLAQKWFEKMRQCGDDVRELIHDGCPVVCVEDAAFGYVNSFKSHVNVGFFYGAELDDSSGLLEGNGRRMRHVKLRAGRELNSEALARLIDASYANIKARLDAERSGIEG